MIPINNTAICNLNYGELYNILNINSNKDKIIILNKKIITLEMEKEIDLAVEKFMKILNSKINYKIDLRDLTETFISCLMYKIIYKNNKESYDKFGNLCYEADSIISSKYNIYTFELLNILQEKIISEIFKNLSVDKNYIKQCISNFMYYLFNSGSSYNHYISYEKVESDVGIIIGNLNVLELVFKAYSRVYYKNTDKELIINYFNEILNCLINNNNYEKTTLINKIILIISSFKIINAISEYKYEDILINSLYIKFNDFLINVFPNKSTFYEELFNNINLFNSLKDDEKIYDIFVEILVMKFNYKINPTRNFIEKYVKRYWFTDRYSFFSSFRNRLITNVVNHPKLKKSLQKEFLVKSL